MTHNPISYKYPGTIVFIMIKSISIPALIESKEFITEFKDTIKYFTRQSRWQGICSRALQVRKQHDDP